MGVSLVYGEDAACALSALDKKNPDAAPGQARAPHRDQMDGWCGS